MPKVPHLTRMLCSVGLAALLVGAAATAFAAPQRTSDSSPPPGVAVPVTRVPVLGTAVVNMAELAAQSARVPNYMKPPERVLDIERNEHDTDPDLQQSVDEPGLPPMLPFTMGRMLPNVASPAPTKSFIGLDDIAMVD